MDTSRPRLPHVHYCPLCDSTWRGGCQCRAPEDTAHLCAACLAYLFSDQKHAA